MTTIDNFNDQWIRICELYNITKKYHLLAEELAGTNYIQPILEQKHALDHIISAYSHISQEEKAIESMNGAIDHLYRAFWDVADWLSLICREGIYKILKKKSIKTIDRKYPEYYSEVRLKLINAPEEIAKLRLEKSNRIEDVNSYCLILDKLVEYYKEIAKRFSRI